MVPIVLAFMAFVAAVVITVMYRIGVCHRTGKSALDLCSQLITGICSMCEFSTLQNFDFRFVFTLKILEVNYYSMIHINKGY